MTYFVGGKAESIRQNKPGLFCCIMLCCTLFASARAESIPQKALRHYAMTTWRTDQGLPQDFITAIAQTGDGFLWVGTMGGIARFDGLHFRTYDSADDLPALHRLISCLESDGKGGLWIGGSGGLVHYSGGKFTALLDQRGAPVHVEDIASVPDGSVWVLSRGGLHHAVGTHLVAYNLPVKTKPLRAIAEGSDGALWLTDGDSILSLRDGKILVHPISDASQVSTISLLYTDAFGGVYAGDGHHLLRWNSEHFEVVRDPGLGNFVGLLVDHAHTLWMASGGLHGISRKGSAGLDHLVAEDGLASNDARILFEDAQHDIWIGTIAGLQRLHDGAFTTYSEADGLPCQKSQCDAVFEDKQHSLWVGTLEGGVARWKDNRFEQFGVEQGLRPGQVRGFADDADHSIIAISDYGLFHWQKGRFTQIPGIPKGYLNSPVRDEHGDLWFGVSHDAIYRLRDGSLSRFGEQEGLPDREPWAILPDGNGGIWAGTNKGLSHWQDGRFKLTLALTSPVVSIRQAADGELLLGTGNGLIILSHDGHARTIAQQEGLPDNLVLSAQQDRDKNLWIATSNAIVRVDHQQVEDFLSGKQRFVRKRIFTQADGLKSRNVLPLNQVTSIQAHDGRLWFATLIGLSVVDPHLPPVMVADATIDTVVVDDLPQQAVDFVVPPGRHRLTFQYTSAYLQSPEQLSFRYRLVGWDKEWLDAGSKREVSYTGLPPANYSFEVVVVNVDGKQSAIPARASVRVRPFFYQTKVFIVFCVIVGIALIVEITRRRTHSIAERWNLRFQERAAERERIAYQIHDTVIQDIIGTALHLELIGLDIAEQPADASRMLEGLATRMRETIARSRNMVSSLHSTAVPDYDLLDVLETSASEFRLGPSPQFHLVSEGQSRKLHPLIRDEVYRICREALANAFRHANAQNIEVRVRFEPQEIKVSVIDDGAGMDDHTRLHGRPGHFGLSSMQAHAQRIGAQVVVESRPEFGTQVKLRVVTSRNRGLPFWRRKHEQESEGRFADSEDGSREADSHSHRG
jgi:signal transduction histidine kinase/ligand-binding sensor domain-containing protein